MKKQRKKTDILESLTEEIVLLGDEMSIVEAQGDEPAMLRNVVLMGPESRQRGGKIRRRYSSQVLESLPGMFEGVRVYANHADPAKIDRERPVGDLIGFVSNPRMGQGGKIRGDISLMEGVGETKRILWCAKHRPSLLGFSPHLRGAERAWQGRERVETITSVASVASADIVTEPATTRGLFESSSEEGEEMDLTKLTIDELRESRPDLLESIRSEGDTAAENVKLKAEITSLTKAAEAREKEQRKTLLESLTADLPETLAATIRALPDETSDDDLKAHVGAIMESVGAKKKTPRSSEKKPADSKPSDEGVTYDQILEASSR